MRFQSIRRKYKRKEFSERLNSASGEGDRDGETMTPSLLESLSTLLRPSLICSQSSGSQPRVTFVPQGYSVQSGDFCWLSQRVLTTG